MTWWQGAVGSLCCSTGTLTVAAKQVVGQVVMVAFPVAAVLQATLQAA